ncbi:MAG: hypothetical protein AB9903_32295 [Vulcanimicrobiota bacterium]
MKLHDSAHNIIDGLIKQGYNAFFYGLTARSLLLRQEPHIYYILTNAGLVELAQCIESIEYPGKAGYDACSREGDLSFRFRIADTSFSTDIMEKLRQFAPHQMYTIDTFIYDPGRQVFYDLWSHYDHIHQKILSPTPHFRELYSSEIRGIFEALLLFSLSGFQISEEFLIQWEPLPFKMKWDDKDEIRDCINALLTSPKSYDVLVMLEQHGILREIVPELAKAENASKRPPTLSVALKTGRRLLTMSSAVVLP